MLKRYAPLMLLAITCFVFFAGLVTNSRASVTQDNTVRVLLPRTGLFEMKGRDIQRSSTTTGATAGRWWRRTKQGVSSRSSCADNPSVLRPDPPAKRRPNASRASVRTVRRQSRPHHRRRSPKPRGLTRRMAHE